MPWEDLSLSDDDFYDKLHEIFNDPGNRHAFEAAAKAPGSQKRASGLYRRIVQHYIRELQHEEAFGEETPTKVTSLQLIDAASRHGDDNRLANVVWAVHEDGGLPDDELLAITAQHPGVGERLNPIVDAVNVAGGTVVDQWEIGLSRLRECLEDADVRHPDSSVVERLEDQVKELRELALAAENERTAAFSLSLMTLMQQHVTVLSDRPTLKSYVDRVEQDPLSIEAPKDGAGVLKELDRILNSLHETVDRIRENSTAVLKADAAERRELLSEISELHATETDQYAIFENLFLQVFSETAAGVQPRSTPHRPLLWSAMGAMTSSAPRR